MNFNFKTRMRGFDRIQVLSQISELMAEYDQKLATYVERIEELEKENSRLLAKLDDNGKQEKIDELESQKDNLLSQMSSLLNDLDELCTDVSLPEKTEKEEKAETDEKAEVDEKAETKSNPADELKSRKSRKEQTKKESKKRVKKEKKAQETKPLKTQGEILAALEDIEL